MNLLNSKHPKSKHSCEVIRKQSMKSVQEKTLHDVSRIKPNSNYPMNSLSTPLHQHESKHSLKSTWQLTHSTKVSTNTPYSQPNKLFLKLPTKWDTQWQRNLHFWFAKCTVKVQIIRAFWTSSLHSHVRAFWTSSLHSHVSMENFNKGNVWSVHQEMKEQTCERQFTKQIKFHLL